MHLVCRERDLRQLLVDVLFLREDALLHLDDPRAMLRDLRVDLGTQSHGFLACADLRLATKSVGFTLRVVDDLVTELSSTTESRFRRPDEHEGAHDRADDEADHDPDGDEHAGLLGRGVRWVATTTPGACRHAVCPESVLRADTFGSAERVLERRCLLPFGVGSVGGRRRIH